MIYLVQRTDDIYYDEYDAFVVRAKSRKEAAEMTRIKGYPLKITLIKPEGKSMEILGSFNAG